MFDNMDIEIQCPYCGRNIIGFQTKDGGCYLHTYVPGGTVDETDGNDGYNSGKEPTSFYCYAGCNHIYEETTKESAELSHQVLRRLKWIWCTVEIPVVDHVISINKDLWKITFEVKTDGCFIMPCNPIDVDKYNSDIEQLEMRMEQSMDLIPK